jgi:hypothetical protein
MLLVLCMLQSLCLQLFNNCVITLSLQCFTLMLLL